MQSSKASGWRVALVFGVLLFGMLASSVAFAQDSITLDRRVKGASKVLGTISAVSPTEVTVASASGEKTVPANQIARLTLSDDPAELRQARQSLLAGQYEQAVETLEKGALPDTARDVLRQEWSYCLAMAKANLALRGSGDVQEALKLTADFLRKERDSFHFYPAVEVLGQLAEAAGKYDDAARYYQQLRKAPWPDYALRPYILTARALRGQGKTAEAIEQYEEALKANATDQEAIRQQTLSRIGRASCRAAAGAAEAEAAVTELEEIVAKNDPDDQELFAEAYLALGDAYRQLQRPMDASLAYLHIDLLFYSQRDAHAQALYYLTTLWPQLQQPDRAVEAKKLLNERYPGTVWSRKAG